jgi:hypothetical protein
MKTRHQQILEALAVLTPTAQFVLIDDNYEGIDWQSDSIEKPSLTALELEISKPKAEPTVEQKLASVGLNLDDLKSALGL